MQNIAWVGVILISLFASSCSAPGPYIALDGASQVPPSSGGVAGYILPICSGEQGITDQFGGYIGKIGGADLMGANNPDGLINTNSTSSAFNVTDAQEANYNDVTAGLNAGVGAGGYWMLGGPQPYDNLNLNDMPTPIADQFSVLPAFAQSMTLAWKWGYIQGLDAIDDWIANISSVVPLNFPFIWADVEKNVMQFIWKDGSTHTSTDNYWDLGTAASDYQANRDVWDGFYSGVYGVVQSQRVVELQGMYSSPGWWDAITGNLNGISNPEWTSESEFAAGNPTQGTCPTSFSSSPGAQFFGGQPSSGGGADAIAWQWIEGKGTQPQSDYDYIQYNNVISCEVSSSNLQDCT